MADIHKAIIHKRFVEIIKLSDAGLLPEAVDRLLFYHALRPLLLHQG
ncbi:hypothetical protein RAC90_19335 [Pantoea sp. CS_6]|nr:hypothetical protein [Pantoea ananatis]